MKEVHIVVRTEGMYESQDFPVRAFDDEAVAKAFAEECTATFKEQHERYRANRDRHGEKWWDFEVKKTDAIEARYERRLVDRCCSIKNSDVSWSVWTVPFGALSAADGAKP